MKNSDPFFNHEAVAYGLVWNAALRQQARKSGMGTGQLQTLVCLYVLTHEQRLRISTANTSTLAKASTISISLLRAYIRELVGSGAVRRVAYYPRAERQLSVTEAGLSIVRSYLLALSRRAYAFQKVSP